MHSNKKQSTDINIRNIKKILNKIIDSLLDERYKKQTQDDFLPVWNEKESLISVLNKVVSMMVKISLIENRINNKDTKKYTPSAQEIKQNEEILNRYIEKRIKQSLKEKYSQGK